MGFFDILNTGLQAGELLLNQINTRKQWEREDNAVQRRVADLKRAGLSPVLAAGSAASSSPAIRAEAPQFKLDYETRRSGIDATRAQTELTRQEIESRELDKVVKQNMLGELRRNASEGGKKSYELANAMIDRMITDEERKTVENQEYGRNVGIYKKYGVPSIGTAGDDIIANTLLLKNVIPDLDPAKAGGYSVVLRTLLSLMARRR